MGDSLAFSAFADYRYVSNNPVIKVDPSGRDGQTFYVCERLVR